MSDEPTAGPAPEPAASRRRPALLLAVGLVLVALVAAGIWWQGSRGDDDVADPAGSVSLDATVEPEGVAFGDSGTLVEVFVDYQCPHCADLEQVIGDELAAIVTAGEANVLVRPVEFLSRASGRGAAALSCAAPSGDAFAMHAALLGDIDGDFTPDGLTALAGTLGLDEDAFNGCLTDRETARWVDGVSDAARTDGITSIPVVKVDGIRLNDAQLESAAAFRAAVEEFGE